MEEKIKKIALNAIAEKVFPGCVVGLIKQGKQTIIPFGRQTYETNRRPISEESIFDVASITKSIPTASLALLLIDRGQLRLDDKLITYVPEFQNRDRERVLIRHLLTHALDFDLTLSSLKDQEPDAILHRIFTARFKSMPGTKYAYVNATSILLGLVIERVSKKPLDVFAMEEFFAPLSMQRTTFHPNQFPKEEIVPTEIDPWRGRLIQGEVHDESAYALSKKYIVGSAGLFSTAPDLLTFLEMLLQNGTYKGRTYFSARSIGRFAGLGWELYQPSYMGDYCTEYTFGKTGFTGCVAVCDVTRGIAFVMLSNYTYPKRRFDAEAITVVRRTIADIIFSHL